MNEKKFAEQFGNIDSAFVDEALNYRPLKSKGGIHMSKKKMVSIALAAALVVAVGATTVAATLSGLSKMKGYFDNVEDDYDNIAGMPVIEDAEQYGTEVNSSAVSGTVSAQVASVTCDEHSIYALVDITMQGATVPDDLTEEAYFTFREWRNENHAISCRSELISREGDVFTYVYHFAGMRKLPEEDIVIKLTDFGYYATGMMYDENRNDLFIPLAECQLDLRISASELNVQQAVNAQSPVLVRGVEMKAELSPLGILLYGDLAEIEEKTSVYSEELDMMISDKYFLDAKSFQFCMKDGTVVGDGENYETVYGLISAVNGWVDPDTGLKYTYIGFAAPIDVSQVECVLVHGAQFDFASAE